LRQDYRGLEDLLASSAELRAALGLESVPDHSTFHGFMRHRVTPTLRKAALVPEAFPAGGDRLFPAPGPPRLREASGKAVPDVVDGRVGPAPGHLCPGGSGRPEGPSRLLPPLVREAVRRLLADADYDSEPTHRWLREEPGIESIIPATGCCPGRARTPYRRRRPRYFPRRKYGRRWIAETVASVLQRKFGEARTTRRKQALLRGLVYNLRQAVAVLWVHRLFPVGRRPLKMLTASPLP
jgi:hypothetical protein